MSGDLVNIIFGMKLRQARTEAGLTLTELAEQSKLSISYLTEIEKGSKYPRTDKILKMAAVLQKDYDELVSIQLEPGLVHLETALSSSVLRQFPFEEFGLEISSLVRLLTRAPVQASALLHALINIGRSYDMSHEQFLLAALRSYQEIHENYFPEIETEADGFAEKYSISVDGAPPTARLEQILQAEFGYQLDYDRLTRDRELADFRTIFIDGSRPRLLINERLQDHQIKFLLARELGYCVLNLKERSRTSTPHQINSFQQLLNDFLASYFGGALLMPSTAFVRDIQTLFNLERWNPKPLLDMLTRYDVTPEMLLYRFSELIPERFGLRLHFLRFHDVDGSYYLYKQLHMNNLMLPSGVGLHEHHCRRWLSIRLLRGLDAPNGTAADDNVPRVGIQMSEFLESQERFLCIGFARPLVMQPAVRSSVIVGFQNTPALKNTIRFVDDSTIPNVIINETCERCPLLEDQCAERAAAPKVLRQQGEHEKRRRAAQKLLAEMKP